MFEEYSYEIIAAVALIILFLVYEIIKFKITPRIKEKKAPKVKEELTSKEVTGVKLDQYDDNNGAFHDVIYKEIKEKIKKQKEIQEQETHPIITKVTKKSEVKVQEEIPTKTLGKYVIDKRSVPPHTKITKEHFKEFAGSRILVAEDNIINQKVIKGLLADTGIEIIIANDGQEALDILQKDRDFLMILMDAHMPNVDGFEAARIIRKNPKYDKILVVALSGDTALDDIKKMQDAGMSEQLEKPLKISALYDILYAYSGKSATIQVPMTKELNGAIGLEICGGDEKFYNDILHEFVDMYKESTHELGDFLHNEQFEEASKLLLDIIGVTANIGAKPLNKTALEIKTALLDKQEASYLQLVDIYKKQLESLISDIINYHRS
jgi:CheY-like chemotaxis protein